jgi:DNA-binding beta-propeller fold protein YncE
MTTGAADGQMIVVRFYDSTPAGSALAVGSNPFSIAIDPTGTYAYVANFGAGTVTKIDLSTFLTVGSAATGTLPQPGLYCAFVSVIETGGQASEYGSRIFVCEATAPPTPTWISATAGNDPITGAPRVTLVLSVSDTGFTGQCSLAVLRSDGAYVRGYGWPSGVYTPIPAGGGSFTVYDYETVPGTSYTYTAQLLAWPPLVSLWSASSGSVKTTTNNAWFILDPTNVATAAQFFPGSVTFTDHEAATTFEPLGTRGTLIKSGAGMKGRQGSIAAGVVTQAAYQQLRAVLTETGTLLLQGPLEQQYVTVFGDRSGVLTPTTAAAPQGNYWDVITFATVEQTRP